MTRGHHRGAGELRKIATDIAQGRYESPANIGRTRPLETQQTAAGLVLAPRTQLITQRFEQPRQRVIALMTPTTGPSGTTPWQAPWDGTTTAPTAPGQVFTAPLLPDPSMGMRVELRWGAGGFAGVTQFDYPAVGCAFGLTCDTVDLSVITPDPGAPAVYTAETVPQVGAWMVEGIAADPSPLRWLEPVRNLAAGTVRYFMVKPFARKLHMAIAAASVIVAWHDRAGATLFSQAFEVDPATPGQFLDVVLDVPAQSVYVDIQNPGAVDASCSLEWQIGLV